MLEFRVFIIELYFMMSRSERGILGFTTLTHTADRPLALDSGGLNLMSRVFVIHENFPD
jgi:hypothetical protein